MSSAAIKGGRVAIEIGADAKKFYAALNALQGRIRNLGATLNGIGARFAGLGAAIAAPMAIAVRQTAAFQDTMAAVGAVTDATGADFEKLKQKALDLGASTSFTAQQVAEGMQALGQGGFSVDETLTGIEGTLLLARAGMLDLGTATGIAVAVLRSFKMPTQEAGKVADILAKAANSSNATVEGLGEALSTVGGIAYTAGISLTELTASIGLLADRGMQGSEAGTAMRRVLIGLAQEQGKLKELGIEVKDPKTGKLKELKIILEELRTKMAGMDETDKIAKLSKIFDVFGANAVIQLMNAGDALDTLDQKLKDSEGSAATVAKKMDDTLGGSFRMFSSAVEAVSLAIGESLTAELRGLLAYLTRIATGLSKAVQANKEWVVAIAKAAALTAAAGAALIGLGSSLQIVAFAVGGFSTALRVVLSPATAVIGLSKVLVGAFASVATAAVGASAAISAAFVRALAGSVAFAARTTAIAVTYAASVAAMAATTVGSMIAITAAWIGAAVASAAAWIANIKAMITYYTGALAGMVAITISRAGAIAGAWIAQAGAAVASFVGAAATGLAAYVGSVAAAASATVASAAAMAAAWLAPVAPILALGGAIVGISVALRSAFSSGGDVAASIGSLFGPLKQGFMGVLADATKVFSDLWGIATVTFGGISDAITAGDMSLAFDVLWAGLKVAWLRGQQGVMSYVDTFVEYLQNRWGDATTFIAQAMVRSLGMIERAWITTSGLLFQTFQQSINSVMNVWDTAVGAIQKAIAYIRSFFDDSVDYEAVKKQIDAANKERKKARDKDAVDAKSANEDRLKESKEVEDGAVEILTDDNEAAKEDRRKRSEDNAAQRQGDVSTAQGELGDVRMKAAGARQAVDLEKSIAEATTPDELRDILATARELRAEGAISAQRLAEIEASVDEQTGEIDKTRAMKAQDDEAAARNKGDAERSGRSVSEATAKVDTAGTFSAVAAMQMGNQSSLAERTAKATEETAKNTKRPGATVQP
jgi:TP901 family phage tail tape measure protein